MDNEKVKAKVIDDSVMFEKIAGDSNDEPKPRRKRRTLKKDVLKVPVKSAPLIDVLFNQVLSPRIGKKWELSSQEIAALGQAADPVMVKYIGSFFNL